VPSTECSRDMCGRIWALSRRRPLLSCWHRVSLRNMSFVKVEVLSANEYFIER
jgi:hypothetical protein